MTKAGTCLCSSTRSLSIDKGDSRSFYAIFAAPPPDVTKANIEIPRMGTFIDVPIS